MPGTLPPTCRRGGFFAGIRVTCAASSTRAFRVWARCCSCRSLHNLTTGLRVGASDAPGRSVDEISFARHDVGDDTRSPHLAFRGASPTAPSSGDGLWTRCGLRAFANADRPRARGLPSTLRRCHLDHLRTKRDRSMRRPHFSGVLSCIAPGPSATKPQIPRALRWAARKFGTEREGSWQARD